MIPLLAAGPEFDRIRAMAAALGSRAGELGDDCALIEFDGAWLALSTDLSVEQVHFRRDWLTLEEIGWRAAAGALSDLAAVGAEAIGLLTSIAVPEYAAPNDSVALMEGIGAAADAVGGKVLGGDLSRGPVWTIDVTVLGRAALPVRRAGAEAGDNIWVTGTLGGARAALEALRSGRNPGADARAAFAHPVPRIAQGCWLAKAGAHAMLDLSDGLAGDAGHLAAASRVALLIELDRIPLGQDVAEAASSGSENAHAFAAMGGEDYELLVALPAGFGTEQQNRFERELGVPLTRIGSVQPGEGVTLRLDGQVISLHGFDHFR